MRDKWIRDQASLLREYMHLQGSGCYQEVEWHGFLRGELAAS